MAVIEPRTVRLRDGRDAVIRSLRPEDAAARIEFRVNTSDESAFTATLADEVERDLGKQLEQVRLQTEGRGRLSLAAEAEGRLIGLLDFRNGERRRLAHHGHFGITVLEGWQGVGLGTAMIRALLDWAAANPLIEKVCLGVFEENTAARRLYKRLGFAEEGRRWREFKLGPGRYADDIQMCVYTKPGIAPPGFNTYTPDAALRGDRP